MKRRQKEGREELISAELLENGGKIGGGLENCKANVRNLYCGISEFYGLVFFIIHRISFFIQ